MKVATATQRELAAQGRVSAATVNKDSVWSEGLVGAARMVAAATSTLCEAANAAVQVCVRESESVCVCVCVCVFETRYHCERGYYLMNNT